MMLLFYNIRTSKNDCTVCLVQVACLIFVTLFFFAEDKALAIFLNEMEPPDTPPEV